MTGPHVSTRTPLPENPGVKDLLEAMLRQPAELARHATASSQKALLTYLLLALVSMLVFGFVLGTFSYHEQLWAAPLKLAGALMFAGLICFPSFYIFTSLAGAQASVQKLAAAVCGMLAVAGLLLLGFAPAVWIFTQGTNSLGFMGAIAILSWLVALLFAFRFVRATLREHGATQFGPIFIWGVIFTLVSLQLTSTVRPILGTAPWFMTSEKKFFLQHWGESIDKSLDDDATPPPTSVTPKDLRDLREEDP